MAILARQQARTEDPRQGRTLLTGAALSRNRLLFQKYMTEAPVEEVAASEAAKVTEEKPREVAQGFDQPSAIKAPRKVGRPIRPNMGPAVGKVNWYLHTQVKIRVQRLAGMGDQLKEQVQALHPDSQSKPAAPAARPVFELGASNGKSNAAKESAGLNGNVTAEKKKHSATKKEKSVAEKEPVKVAAKGESTSKKGKKAKKGAGKESKTVSKVGRADDNYEIGSFSNFTFLDEVDSEDGSEMDSAVLAESVTLSTPDVNAPFSELIIEENDRRLEILVTPEQLATYFKGKLPETPVTPSEDTPRLEFNFEPGMAPMKVVADEEEQDSPEEVLPTAEEKAESEDRMQLLISRFIQDEPTITRKSTQENTKGDLSRSSVKEDDEDEWVTETLAQIHALQGNTSKAIEIYRKLTLIFPEKKTYFDDRIQNLKK